MNTIQKLENFYPKETTCFFCETKKSETKNILFFLNSENKCICENCLDYLYEIKNLERNNTPKIENKYGNNQHNLTNELTPKIIKEKLDEYVIGQERAKKILSIVAYNHCLQWEYPDLDIEKTNVLLCGPSGCGKTYLVDTLSKIIDVPFVTIDITAFSETGYKGKDASEIIQSLLIAADGDVEKAEHGIIFIDEIDKTAGKGVNSGVGDIKVQSSLLKMIDGIKQDFKYDDNSSNVVVDTKNVMFIFAGAFAGISELKQQRTSKMGFTSNSIGDLVNQISLETRDLILYGMLPELVGRMHRIVEMNELSQNDLIDIMKKPKKSICKQYQDILHTKDIELNFDDTAYQLIAKTAIQSKLGARALRNIIEDTMEDLLYTFPNETDISKITITENMIKDGKGKYVEETK